MASGRGPEGEERMRSDWRVRTSVKLAKLETAALLARRMERKTAIPSESSRSSNREREGKRRQCRNVNWRNNGPVRDGVVGGRCGVEGRLMLCDFATLRRAAKRSDDRCERLLRCG